MWNLNSIDAIIRTLITALVGLSLLGYPLRSGADDVETTTTPLAAQEPITSIPIPDPYKEIRYCGVIRDAVGNTARSHQIIEAFRKEHPCPVTGKAYGACKGWAIDHVVSLDCGGCDTVWNMQWLPVEIKSCAGQFCKDRWERRVYYSPKIGATKGCHP